MASDFQRWLGRGAAMLLACLFWGTAPAWAICSVTPHVCTEFFASTAVFTGVVESERADQSPEYIDGYYYRLRVATVYRGAPLKFIDVYTMNDSGRLTLEVGHSYLVFARRYKGRLLIGCGDDSGELTKAGKTIAEIKRLLAALPTAHGGDIWGMVRFSDGEPEKGVAGLRIAVRDQGKGHTYLAQTNCEGRFRIHVPAGVYRAEITSTEWKQEFEVYSYERAEGFKVENGGCADVIMLASPRDGVTHSAPPCLAN